MYFLELFYFLEWVELYKCSCYWLSPVHITFVCIIRKQARLVKELRQITYVIRSISEKYRWLKWSPKSGNNGMSAMVWRRPRVGDDMTTKVWRQSVDDSTTATTNWRILNDHDIVAQLCDDDGMPTMAWGRWEHCDGRTAKARKRLQDGVMMIWWRSGSNLLKAVARWRWHDNQRLITMTWRQWHDDYGMTTTKWQRRHVGAGGHLHHLPPRRPALIRSISGVIF